MSGFNGVGWFEIGTDQPAVAERFYGDVFGWSFADDNDSTGADGSPYRIVTTPADSGLVQGGLNATGGTVPNYAVFYVTVQDTGETCRRTEAAGGKVLMAPRTDRSGLTFAHLLDPSGNHIGVFTPPTAH